MSNSPNNSKEGDTGNKRKRTESNSDANLPSWMTTSSPPRFVSFEELMNTAAGLDNMAIAHEIAINDDFKLEKVEPPPSDQSLQKKIHDIVHQAFWDSLKDDLNRPSPVYKHALILLAEMKQTLLSLLLPHHTKLQTEIEDHLDMDLFEQQCENKSLEFMPIAQYILGVMSKLCAPVRDESIQKLKQCTDIFLLFKGLFETLDLMKLDMANFAIASIRPTIQQKSVEYERTKFDNYLKINPGGLEYTTNWLRRAVEITRNDDKIETNASKIPSTSSRPRVDRTRILGEAYFMLLEWDDGTSLPETLLIDEARLVDMRNKCLQLIIVSSVVIVTTNFSGKDLADLTMFKNSLKETSIAILEDCDQKNLSERLLNVAEQVCVETEKAVESLSLPKWDQLKKDALKNQINDLATKNNPVRKLLRDRVKSFIMSVIGTTSASPIKIPPGLNIAQKELARLTGSFLRLVSHNRSVFIEYYERILNGLLPIETPNLSSPSAGQDSNDSVEQK